MKQPTPYPHQRQQILARILLTIWLPITCSPEITVATSRSESPVQHRTDIGVAESSTSAMDTPVKIRLIAQEGHLVTVLQNNDVWQAEVDEHLSTGFSNKLYLPVSIKEGIPWQQLATCSEALQRQRVVVAPDCVHIDSRGLWRGNRPLYEVIKQGALALVPEILAQRNSDTNKSDINAVDEHGWSALHWAVSKGYLFTAALLLMHGGNLELEDRQGNTALADANNNDRRYLLAISTLVQLFLTLDNLIADDVIQDKAKKVEIQQNLYKVSDQLEKLELGEAKNTGIHTHFKHLYHTRKAEYLRALANEDASQQETLDEDASDQETLTEKYQEPDVSLLALDAALQETMPDSSFSSQNAGQLLDNQKDNKSLYKECGDDKWRQFMEYWYTQQGQWNLLTRLGRENLDQLSIDQKNALKDAILAHEQYGASCDEAAKEQDLHSEINLRAIMALRLLIVGYFLEAKMYALSICSKLINSPSSDIKVLDLKKAQALLVRVQEAQLACGDRQASINSTANTLNILQRLNYPIQRFSTFTVQKEYSETEKMHIKCAIAQDLQELVRELLLGNTRNLASPPVCDGGSATASSATNTLNIVRKSNKAYSDIDKIEIKCAIAQDLQAIARELLLSNACNLPTIQVPEAKIFRTEQLAKRYKQAGVGIGIAGGLLLCVLVDLGGYVLFKFIQTRKKSSTSLVRAASPSKTSPPSPKNTWRSRLATTITGIFGVLKLAYGRLLWNKGERMSQESIASRGLNDRLAQAQACHGQGNMQGVLDAFSAPYVMNTKRYKQVGGILLFWRSRFAATITGIFGVLTVAYGRLLSNKGERMSQESIALRGLNAMLAQAQACHDQGDMQGALDVLSSSYATNKQLLSLEEIGESSGEKKIIDLLASGIGPDDVASLFLLIGIALRSGKVSILRYPLRHLITRAQHSFGAILRPELAQAIQDLDKRMAEIEEQRNKRSPWEQYVETWKNFLLLRDEDDASLLASVHPVEDAQGMSVQQRLAAISKIAQMEVTSIEMEVTSIEMDTGLSEKNTLADQLCKEAREGMEHYLQLQLYPMPELSSAVIKDSLKVISDHVAAIEVPAVDQQSNSWPASTATQHY